MTQPDVPRYLKYVPALLVAFVIGVAAFIGVTVQRAVEEVGATVDEARGGIFKDALDTIDRFRALLDDFSVEGVDKLLRESVNEQAGKLARQSIQLKPPPVKPADGESVTIMDFTGAPQGSALLTRLSNGSEAAFAIDETQGFITPVSARLEITRFGPVEDKRRQVTGQINLPEPVSTENRAEISFAIKSDVARSIGVGLVSDEDEKGKLWWNMPAMEIGEGWRLVTLSFSDFDKWRYDPSTGRYSLEETWTKPKTISQIRFYLKNRHIGMLKSAIIWIDGISIK